MTVGTQEQAFFEAAMNPPVLEQAQAFGVSTSRLFPDYVLPEAIVEKILTKMDLETVQIMTQLNKDWRTKIQSIRHILKRKRVLKLELRSNGAFLLICCWKDSEQSEQIDSRWRRVIARKYFIAGDDFFHHIAYISPRIASIKGGHPKLSMGLATIPDWWFRNVSQVTYRPGPRYNIDLVELLKRCPQVTDLHYKKDPHCATGYDCADLINAMTSVRRFQMDHIAGTRADDRTLTALIEKSHELRHFIVYELKTNFSLEKIFDVLQRAHFAENYVPFLRFGRLPSAKSELIEYLNLRSRNIAINPRILNVFFRFKFQNEHYTLNSSEWNWNAAQRQIAM
ncbi:unnamed protein product [Caenorhabditis auriculariae]|uniref:F-box domain-containing protein n=1 Tax=Caenorhabditis auriculariae TaxID=2777116 RepID=A0A8S1HIW6_9PELO|nr:unnamed protein product [Caenorhabditis auriculariae]